MAENKSGARNAKAAARVRAAQQQKRQRLQWSIGIVALVVVGIVVLVLAKGSKSANSDTSTATSQTARPAPASVSSDLAKVPISAIHAAYRARVKAKIANDNLVQPVKGAALTKNGKPEVLYMGGEFCPYCAGERWALVTALSKFGTFSGLKVINSSESDVPTLSFVGSKYTSKYLTFTPIELADQNRQPLEKATAAQLKLLQTFGGGNYPFIDFGGHHIQTGGSVAIPVLVGKSQTDIAKTLANATASDTKFESVPGQINSVAGGFIDAICGLTDGKPANTCSAISQT